MRLLIVTHDVPYPPHRDGGTLKLYHLLRELATTDTVHLVACVPAGTADDAGRRLRQLRAAVDLQADIADVPLAAHRPDSPDVPAYRRYWSEHTGNVLWSMVRRRAPDILHFDRAPAAWYRRFVPLWPTVLAPNDCLTLHARRRLTATPRALSAAGWRAQRGLSACRRYEKHYYPLFDERIFVSREDADAWQHLCPGRTAQAIPNGVDTDYFAPNAVDGVEGAKNVVFTGTFDFEPNVTAARRLVRHIWPGIRRAEPDARLYLAGRDPTPDVTACHNGADVVVTGAVDDLRPYLAGAAVYISPLRSGGGFKNKIAEAMAMACPVVATPLGIAGLDEAPALVADADDILVRRVCELLADPERRRQLGGQARDFVVTHCSWRKTADAYRAVYEHLGAGGR